MDYSSLEWVKAEIDVSLTRARHALEDYAEGTGEVQQLENCIEFTHEVSGALEILEMPGAAMLTAEMQRLGKALLSGEVTQKADAQEILMRAIILLPDYLDQVKLSGSENSPALLSILNDIRALLDDSLITESVFFAPNLSAALPNSVQQTDVCTDVKATVKKLRPAFQLGLVQWMRGSDEKAGLELVSRVIHRLDALFCRTPYGRQWWIACGFIDALSDGGVPSGVAVKRLLGQIDRSIKHLGDNGSRSLDRVPDTDLVKNLLYYIAHANTKSDRISQVRYVYKLDELVEGEKVMSGSSDSAGAGINLELLGTVATAIKEDLARAKDILDLHVRADSDEVDDLEPLADLLHNTGDTLGLLNMGAQRQQMVSLSSHVRQILAGEVAADKQKLMAIASNLLDVEAAIDRMARGDLMKRAKPAAGQESDEEKRQLHATVITEALKEIGFAKNEIVNFIKDESLQSTLDEVPEYLHKVSGSLRIMELVEAADIVDRCSGFITGKLANRDESPAQSVLDALADTVVTVEFYLESVAAGRSNSGLVLQSAAGSLEELGSLDYSGGESIAAAPAVEAANEAEHAAEQTSAIDQAGPPAAMETPEIEASVEVQAPAEPAGLQEPVETVVDITAEEPVPAPEVEEITFEALPEEEVSEPEMEVIDLVAEEPTLVLDLEEIALAVAAGADAPESEQEPSMEVMDLSAEEVVPEFEVEEIDIDDLETDIVDITAAPETVAVAALTDEQLAVAAEPPAQAGYEFSTARPADIDEEIVEIFLEEAEEELSSINENFQRWKANVADEDALVTIRRSFHTLKGSGRMVGAEAIGEFAWAFENLLNRILDDTIQATDHIQSLVGQAIGKLEPLVQQFKGEAVDPGDFISLMQAADRCVGADSSGGNAASGPAEPPLPVQEAPAAPVAAAPEPELELEEPEPEQAVQTDKADVINLTRVESQEREAGKEAPSRDPFALENTGSSADQSAEAPPVAESGRGDGWQTQVIDAQDLFAGSDAADDVGDRGEDAGGQVDGEQVEAGESTISKYHPDLFQIFGTEAEHYLDLCVEYIAKARSPGSDRVVTEELLRALHTLRGSARSAKCHPISQLGDVLDTCFERLEGSVNHVDDEALGLLEDAVGRCRTILADLEGLSDDEEMVVGLVDQVREYMRRLPDNAGPVARPAAASTDTGERQVDAAAPQPGSEGLDEEDLELREIFLEEAHEIMDSSERLVNEWRGQPDATVVMQGLQRELHTLKGGARMAGLVEIGDLSHSLESVLIMLAEGRREPGEYVIDLVQQAHDRLAAMIESIQEHRAPQPANDLIGQIEAVISGKPAPAAAGDEDAADGGDPVVEPARSLAEPAGPVSVAGPVDEEAADPRRKVEQVRLNAGMLNSLTDTAGEISISSARIGEHLGLFRGNLSELDETIERLRDQLRRMEMETESQILFRYEETASHVNEGFDPLELDRYSHLQQLSRSLMESVGDLDNLQEHLTDLTSESETILVQQTRLNTDMQTGLMRTRMVPFAGVVPRLRRIVRQIARELGKKVDLLVIGEEGELDRTVLNRIMPPLEHMLRNSVGHGIEMPDVRQAAGKLADGQITIVVGREGSEVLLRIIDDGAGLDLDAIRAKALENGLMTNDADLSDLEVMQFILEPSFTTAKAVSQISGRGVGMDVVASEIKQLSGSLTIESDRGMGTKFIVRLPLTLTVNQALMISVGEEILAVPLNSVEEVVRIPQDELRGIYETQVPIYKHRDRQYRVIHLGSLTNMPFSDFPADGKSLPVLLVRAGEHRMALQVDDLLGSQEIVVKSIGPQLSKVRFLAGATIRGDGRVVLIMDVPALVRLGVALHGVADSVAAAVTAVQAPASLHDGHQTTVMIVDDSITVRKVTSRLLERKGMRVITAKDGIDAVEVLQDQIPDLMLLDVEMPRMDGYELATQVRNDERIKGLPIIMITSRTGAKHRERAEKIGVNRYLGKPYQEQELLENIEQLLEAK